MKGSIRERSPGHWAIILDQRDPATGKRKRKWHSYAGTKRQAQIECARLISELKGGAYVEPSKLTLAQFFARWLIHVKPNVSPRTHERYSDLLNKNLSPVLGAKLLSKLQAIEISEAYAKLLESGRRDGKGGLAPRTVHHIHRALYEALSQAERWKLIARNPAALLEKRDRPKIERKPVVTIDPPTTATVFDAARERRLFIPLVLASLCGLRRGRNNGPALARGRSGQRSAGGRRQHRTNGRRRNPGEGSQERQGQDDRPSLPCRGRIAPLAAGAGSGIVAAGRQGRR